MDNVMLVRKRGNPCCGVYSVVMGDHAGVEQQQQRIDNNAKNMQLVLAAE